MDVVIDLINRVEEQEALVVQNVRRPKTRLESLVDDAALRTRTKVLQLQVRHRPWHRWFGCRTRDHADPTVTWA